MSVRSEELTPEARGAVTDARNTSAVLMKHLADTLHSLDNGGKNNNGALRRLPSTIEAATCLLAEVEAQVQTASQILEEKSSSSSSGGGGSGGVGIIVAGGGGGTAAAAAASGRQFALLSQRHPEQLQQQAHALKKSLDVLNVAFMKVMSTPQKALSNE